MNSALKGGDSNAELCLDVLASKNDTKDLGCEPLYAGWPALNNTMYDDNIYTWLGRVSRYKRHFMYSVFM